MIFKRQILFLLAIFFVHLAVAQGGATIKAIADKNKILLGEVLQLTVEIYLPAGSDQKYIRIDTIEHFEFLEKPVIDSSEKKDGINYKGVYTITSFDSGHWVIPPFVISAGVKTDPIPIDVIFSDFDPGQEYHSIKDIIEVKPPAKKVGWWWYVAGVILFLLLVIMYLLRKKKILPAAAPAISTNPFQEAIQQLEQLQRDKPDVKQYHSKLTDIFRLYIFRKKGILSLQKTTDDLVLQLKNLNLDKQQFDKLSQSLRLSDFVKFAKYLPSEDDNRNCYEETKKAIVTIEKTETKIPL
jgi:hypothetical protein